MTTIPGVLALIINGLKNVLLLKKFTILDKIKQNLETGKKLDYARY